MHLRFSPMNVFLQLLLISSQTLKAVKTAKEDFTIGLFYWYEDEIKVDMNKFMSHINAVLGTTPTSVFNTHFNLKIKIVKLPNEISPMNILNIYCKTILPMKFNVMIIRIMKKGWKDPLAISYFAYFAGPLGIPVLTWDLDVFIPEKKLSNYIVKIYPNVAHLSSAIVSILQRFSWTDFSILTSTNFYNHEFIQNIRAEVLKKESKFKSKVNIQAAIQENKKDRNDDIRDKLVKLSATNTRVILLLYSRGNELKNILKIAEKLGLTGESYIWLVAQMNNQFFDEFSEDYAAPIGSLGVKFDTHDVWLDNLELCICLALELLDGGLQQLIRSSKDINIGLHPNQSCTASEIIRRENGEHFLRYWTKLNFKPGMKLPDAESKYGRQNHKKNLTIINFNDTFSWKECGTWNPSELKLEEDIVWPGNSLTPPYGVPFRHMKIAFMEEPPFIFLHSPNKTSGKCNNGSVVCHGRRQIIDPNRSNYSNSDVQNTSSCCSGYSIDLLKKFAKDLGFTYDLIRVKDGVWGAEVNGQWNGLVAALINQEADIVMTSFTINSFRKAVIDFSIPFLETRIAFLVAKKTGRISAMAFMEPFDTISWIMILIVSIHVVTSAIFMLEWFSPNCNNMKMETPRDNNISVLRSYWLVWANLFGAAVSVDIPRSTSARFMTGIWALFAMVFLGMYTANLTFFMTTPEEYIKLSGLKDDKLVNPDAYNTPLRYGTVSSGHTETILKKYHHVVYNNMKKFNISTIEEGMKAVATGELDAFIYDATVLKYLLDQDQTCMNFKIEGGNVITEYGIGFPKYSKYLSTFNKQLMIYEKNGFLENLQETWMKATYKVEVKRRSSEPLSLHQFMGAFVLLGLGVILSVVLLIIEWLYARFYINGPVRKIAKRKCGKIDLGSHQERTFRGKYFLKRRNSESSVFKIMRPELHRVHAINYEKERIRYVWSCQDKQ